MALFKVSNTKIVGVSGAVPKNKASNKDLVGLNKQQIDLLIKTTGIESRRVSPDEVCASDLCYTAAEKLIAELGWKKDEIGALIFVTQTPDYPIPGTSMILQDRLNLPKSCMTIDINQGCAGYVYGLSVISSLLSSGGIKKGLLLVGDTITKLIEKGDNSVVPIFSDAGTATAVEFDTESEDMSFNLQTDGSGYEAIIVPEGGSRDVSKASIKKMRMQGHSVFTFALKEVVPNINAVLEFAAREKDQVDYYIFHQANKLLNESIRRKMGIDSSKVPYTLSKFGNTSCATIPLTLISELSNEVKSQNLNLILSGFGVGLSWGACCLNISDIVCPDLIEL